MPARRGLAHGARAIAVLIALLTPLWPSSRATRADDYGYPYRDPYLATLSVGLLRTQLPHRGTNPATLSISMIPSRDDVPLMEGRGRIQALYFRQKHPAPFLFIVPGAGSSAYDWPTRYFAERFYRRGFHVVMLPGTMTWNFALAASSSGLPGVKDQDARDLYKVMAAALEEVKSEYDAQITKIGFLGVSMGGLDGAYVSALDTRERTIGISRFLLINPPVDLFYAGDVVDQFYDEGRSWSREERNVLLGKMIDTSLDRYRERRSSPDPFPLDVRPLLPLSEAQRRFLIGYDLRQSLGGVVYVSQLIHDRGILKTPIDPSRPSPRVAEAASFSVREYIERLLLPDYSERTGRRITFDQLGMKASLRSLSLGTDPRVYVMHNADDFLVTSSHLAFLRQTLGNRLTLYPLGGHIGNMWYPENSDAILAAFESM